ncbi:MAG: ECF-type sigma factor [Planctomycetota bacterium]
MALSPEPGIRADRAAIARALHSAAAGDAGAEAALTGLVYGDLRRLAATLLRCERPGHTLQPTALVHEAWLRLADDSALHGVDIGEARRRFLGHAVRAMRRILVEHARRRAADKRGGARERVGLADCEGQGLAFDGMPRLGAVDASDLLDLDEALVSLSSHSPRVARVAELRIYGGLTTAEAAEAVSVSLATAKADWALAQALLTQWVRQGRGAR